MELLLGSVGMSVLLEVCVSLQRSRWEFLKLILSNADGDVCNVML